MRRLLAAFIVGAVLAAACGSSDSSTASTGTAPPTTSGETAPSTTSTTSTPEDTTATTTATTTPVDQPPRPGGSVVIAEDQEPPTLNPYVPGGDNFIVAIIGQAHMAGAYDIDAQTRELIPELVVEVPTVGNGGVTLNEDGTMTVRWLIRDDAVWSDGVPISGEDFAFTIEFQAATNECWDPDAPYVPDPFELDGEIEAVDAKTIAIRFDQPGFRHESLFDWIVPKHAVEGTNYCDDWNDTTWPAAGPFVVQEWQPGDHVKLVRNQNYWKSDPESGMNLPYLDEVEFRFIPEIESIVQAFRQREVDVLQPPPLFETATALQALDGADVQILRGPVWEHFSFQFGPNNRNPDSMNGSRSYRQAIAHALDRQLLVDEAFSGMLPEPIDGFLQVVNPDASSEPWAVYDYNPERAAALLETACEELERDCESTPPKLIFSSTSNGDIRVRWANLLEDMLAKSGIEVELQMEDSQLFFGETLDNGDWDVGLWAWVGSPGAGGLVSTMGFFDPDDPAPDGSNYYRWGTPGSVVQDDEGVATFREVLGELRSAYDYNEIKRLAGVLELILAEEMVIIPVTARITMGAVWGDEIAGFQMNPTQAGHTWNIERWRRIDLG
jgi:peptide/nickel transport system substrate-binding protein